MADVLSLMRGQKCSGRSGSGIDPHVGFISAMAADAMAFGQMIFRRFCSWSCDERFIWHLLQRAGNLHFSVVAAVCTGTYLFEFFFRHCSLLVNGNMEMIYSAPGTGFKKPVTFYTSLHQRSMLSERQRSTRRIPARNHRNRTYDAKKTLTGKLKPIGVKSNASINRNEIRNNRLNFVFR